MIGKCSSNARPGETVVLTGRFLNAPMESFFSFLKTELVHKPGSSLGVKPGPHSLSTSRPFTIDNGDT